MSINVSIVIPVFNGEKTLRACIESLKTQSIAPEEIIVVDNGSNDRTAEIAKEFEVTYHFLTERSRSKARNKGASLSASEVICFMDCDVEAPSNLIEEIQIAFQHRYINVFSMALVPKGQRFLDLYRRNFKAYISNRSYLDCFEKDRIRPLANSALMAIRKKYFLAIGKFNESYFRSEDRELSERIFKAAGIMMFKSIPYGQVEFAGGCVDYLRRSFQSGITNEFLYPGIRKRNHNFFSGCPSFFHHGGSVSATIFLALNNAIRMIGGLYARYTIVEPPSPIPVPYQHASARNTYIIRFIKNGKLYVLSPDVRLCLVDDLIYASHLRRGTQIRISKDRTRILKNLLDSTIIHSKFENIIDELSLEYFLSHEILEIKC